MNENINDKIVEKAHQNNGVLKRNNKMTKEEVIKCLESNKTFSDADICTKCPFLNKCDPDEAIDIAIRCVEIAFPT